MSATLPTLSNETARRIFLDRHGLIPRQGETLEALIHRLGFVQVDSVNTVARAHDMILFSRRPSYRPRHLQRLLEKDRALFEHWTHDAAVIPAEFFPHWRLRFARDKDRLLARWAELRRGNFHEKLDEVLEHIARHGPTGSAGLGEGEKRGSGGWWDWHPSKTALEYLWRTGDLSVTRREAFRKIYDLTGNVLPEHHLQPRPEVGETVAWACGAALDRLGMATPGELAAFWDLVTPAEARDWAAAALRRGEVQEVMVEMAPGQAPRRMLARPGLLDEEPPAPPGRLRILSPFDPALRNRQRAERLFGFHYRIEIFTPAPQRKYGYYVFPILEGSRLLGRIDMICRRSEGVLDITALWPERGVAWGKGRMARLESELARIQRLTGSERLRWQDGWLRDPL